MTTGSQSEIDTLAHMTTDSQSGIMKNIKTIFNSLITFLEYCLLAFSVGLFLKELIPYQSERLTCTSTTGLIHFFHYCSHAKVLIISV